MNGKRRRVSQNLLQEGIIYERQKQNETQRYGNSEYDTCCDTGRSVDPCRIYLEICTAVGS
jgi:hypothetical protein